MDQSVQSFVSLILTSFNEGHHLDRILKDISRQEYPVEKMEVLLLEAGDYPEERARFILSEKSDLLRFWGTPGLCRTISLNNLVKESKGDLIVRLDARCHIQPDYIQEIVLLSLRENAANVGGVQVPVGETVAQERIALVMGHPLCFGGGKFRDLNYIGSADSVYLGAFNRKLMPPEPWFDEEYPKISEDSDLNYRIRKIGGDVIVDSKIRVEHFPRETLKAFLKLCYNYGVGRGLFCIKHRKVSAGRQMVLPAGFLVGVALLLLGLFYPVFLGALAIGVTAYIVLIGLVSFRASKNKGKDYVYLMTCFIGCHLFWLTGFLTCFISNSSDEQSRMSGVEG
jgi:succinoglycan biosynthesis protein ExoA